MLLDQGAGLSARDISDIQSGLKSCTCSGAPGATDEPFKSLFDLLPVDEPTLNRRDISAKGVGLLLSDIQEVQ